MARHALKVSLLLVPSLATVVLLLYCMFSDSWVSINMERLHNVTVLYENEYNVVTGKAVAFTNLDRSGDSINQVVSFRDKVTTEATTTTTRTTTTTTTTTTTPIDSGEMYEAEETDSTNHEEETGEEYPAESSNENLLDKNTRARRQVGRNNFVYITKLWPLTRFKGLYSECIQYFPFKLKISKAYLNLENKEPIIGVIDYLDTLNSSRQTKTCDEKAGQILCPLNKKCVTGKT
jgi:hypothetical protein